MYPSQWMNFMPCKGWLIAAHDLEPSKWRALWSGIADRHQEMKKVAFRRIFVMTQHRYPDINYYNFIVRLFSNSAMQLLVEMDLDQ